MRIRFKGLQVFRVGRAWDVLLCVGLVLTIWRVVVTVEDGAPSSGVPRVRLDVGSQLDLQELRAIGSPRAVVLALRTTCPSCAASLALYKRLAKRVSSAGIPLVVLAREPEAVMSGWLVTAGVHPSKVISLPSLEDIGVVVTPTLLLIDSSMTVTDIVTGTLLAADEQRLYERLAGSGDPLVTVTYAKLVHAAELSYLASAPVLLDVRDREAYARKHRAGAVNIPYDEVEARGVVELSLVRPIVIDCADTRFMPCEIAGEALIRLGVESVSILVPEAGRE
jgi:rhodanese-related sulfurtransferase